jgi:hypothetical protein
VPTRRLAGILQKSNARWLCRVTCQAGVRARMQLSTISTDRNPNRCCCLHLHRLLELSAYLRPVAGKGVPVGRWPDSIQSLVCDGCICNGRMVEDEQRGNEYGRLFGLASIILSGLRATKCLCNSIWLKIHLQLVYVPKASLATSKWRLEQLDIS